jgi:hypothetical protein
MTQIPDELFQIYEKAISDGDRQLAEKIKRVIRDIKSEPRIIERHTSITPARSPEIKKPKFRM